VDVGLPPTGFVFCSFNNIYKINPRIFSAWMQILRETDGSVLWLSKPEPDALANLRMQAQHHGVNPDRLVFAQRVPLVEDHLARYRLADLFLDTTPYNAHTTAADALFVGLPVLTCQGKTFSGKVAASLLQAIGMPELVTESIEHYVQLALELSRDPARLGAWKQKLMDHINTHPLFQTRQYCRHLESAFTTMHSQQHAGGGLSSFAVDRLPSA
jgi:predicted O-linked N-acetylglucosamine transferase (SPINDLY family)